MKSRVFELYHFCLDGPASCKVNIAIMAKASVYVEHKAISDTYVTEVDCEAIGDVTGSLVSGYKHQ